MRDGFEWVCANCGANGLASWWNPPDQYHRFCSEECAVEVEGLVRCSRCDQWQSPDAFSAAELGRQRRCRSCLGVTPLVERQARQHGTRQRYITDRCRCAECRAAQADYMRAYYHRRQAALRGGG